MVRPIFESTITVSITTTIILTPPQPLLELAKKLGI